MEKKNIKAYFASGLWRRRYTVQVQGRERGMKFADCEPTNQPNNELKLNFNNQEGAKIDIFIVYYIF